MARPGPRQPSDPSPGPADQLRGLPVDPDLDAAEERRHRRDLGRRPFVAPRRHRWPRVHWTSVAMVGFGGFFGGLTRYGVGLAWPTASGAFPWSIFGVNTVGTFILALLLVLVLEVLPPTTYLRPAIGTGFCGALTTFSSVVTSADELAAHNHADVAVGYVVASVLAGLAAAVCGLIIGRSIAVDRGKGQE